MVRKIYENKIIIGSVFVILLLLFIGVMVIRNITESKMDEDDLYVLKCVEALYEEKGDIKLENDILYSEQNKIYVVIEFSSGSGRDTAYFEDAIFIGTDSDYDRIKYYDMDDVNAGRITKDEYKRILKKMISFEAGKVEVSTWNLMAKSGMDIEDRHLVSAKKIAKKLGISYSKN